MKTNRKYLIGVAALVLATMTASPASAQDNTVTNPIPNNPMTAPVQPTSLTAIGNSLGAAPARVASDGYLVFKNFSLTNPIAISAVGLKNGSLWGGGLAASTANTNSLMNAGFGVFAVQTKNAQDHTQWSFYDATLNLQIQQVETIPLLNLPITLRLESGPYVQLSRGGNALGAQNAAFGDLTFGSARFWLTLGGGVVNITGAGLQPILPMAHLTVTVTF